MLDAAYEQGPLMLDVARRNAETSQFDLTINSVPFIIDFVPLET